MPITRTPMVDDDGSGTTGTVINNSWKQELYNQIDAALAGIGVWTTIPYNAADYTASGGAWTVEAADLTVFRYCLIGKTAIVNFAVQATSLAVAGPDLLVRLPAALTAAADTTTVVRVFNSGGLGETGIAFVQNGQARFIVERVPYSNWSVQTNALRLDVVLVFQVQ